MRVKIFVVKYPPKQDGVDAVQVRTAVGAIV